MAGPTALRHLIGVNVTHACFDLTPRLSPFPKCVCVCWGGGECPVAPISDLLRKEHSKPCFHLLSLPFSLTYTQLCIYMHSPFISVLQTRSHRHTGKAQPSPPLWEPPAWSLGLGLGV